MAAWRHGGTESGGRAGPNPAAAPTQNPAAAPAPIYRDCERPVKDIGAGGYVRSGSLPVYL